MNLPSLTWCTHHVSGWPLCNKVLGPLGTSKNCGKPGSACIQFRPSLQIPVRRLTDTHQHSRLLDLKQCMEQRTILLPTANILRVTMKEKNPSPLAAAQWTPKRFFSKRSQGGGGDVNPSSPDAQAWEQRTSSSRVPGHTDTQSQWQTISVDSYILLAGMKVGRWLDSKVGHLGLDPDCRTIMWPPWTLAEAEMVIWSCSHGKGKKHPERHVGV